MDRAPSLAQPSRGRALALLVLASLLAGLTASTISAPADAAPHAGVPTIRVLDAGYNAGFYTSMVLDDRGLPAISYYDDNAGRLLLLRCADAACTISRRAVLDDDGVTGLSTSLALDADDRPVISYLDLDGRRIRLLRCHSPACTASTRVEVDAAVADVTPTAVAVRPDGTAVVAYAAGDQLRLATCLQGADGCEIIHVAAGVEPHLDLLVEGDPPGRAAIAYRDAGSRTLRLARCSVDGCRTATLDGTRGSGLQPSLTTAPDGNLAVAHLDLLGGTLRLTRCDDPACTSTTHAPLVTSESAGFFPALAWRADGTPAVAYYDEPRRSLWLASCDDEACTSVRGEVVDALGTVGLHSSMVIDEQDRPIVAYLDQTARQLKLAHCAVPSCAAPTEASTVGRRPAISLGPDDTVQLVYRSPRPRDVRVARCLDPTCTTTHVAPADEQAFVGLHPAGIVTPGGAPLVSYVDVDGSVLRLAGCRPDDGATDVPTTCPYLDASTVRTVGDVGAFSRAVMAGGRFVLLHRDRSNSHLLLESCALASCHGAPGTGDALATAVVARDVPGGGPVGLAATPDGGIVILHQRPNDATLHLITCPTATCTTSSERRLAEQAAPWPVEVAVAADGRITTLHRDLATGALTLATCGDLACRDRTSSAAIPDGVEVSLALDAEARPVVVALVAGRGVVVARCDDRACTTTQQRVLSTRDGIGTGVVISDDGVLTVATYALDTAEPILLVCPDGTCDTVERRRVQLRARR